MNDPIETVPAPAPDTAEVAYKFLGPGRESWHGGSGAWPEPGVWAPRLTALVPCKRGYHVCRQRHLLEWLGPELWRVEWRGEMVDAGDKLVVGEARLIGRVAAWDDRTARLFACDCAERVLHLAEPDERYVAAIATARRFAAGEASGEELAAARAAAWDAARAAARAAARDTAWDAARDAARDTAWGAARDTAWVAARDTAWVAAGAAARAAAWDATGAAARAAAWDTARVAERSWQTARLIEMLGISDDSPCPPLSPAPPASATPS